MAASSIQAATDIVESPAQAVTLLEECCRQVPELRQREERLRAIGEMTAEFAHQLRTPLATALLYVGQVEAGTAQQQRIVEKITARLGDLRRMIDDMLGFAAGSQPRKQQLAIVDLFTAVKRTIDPQLAESTRLHVHCDDDALRIAANKESLKGALLNLICNAEQACETEASITLSARRESQRILIEVSDNGPGVPQQIQRRIFEPFFTTRPSGTGLGLAVVHAVVKAHFGDVLLETTAAGSTFTLSLPALPEKGEEHD